jgi:hypothetical protein
MKQGAASPYNDHLYLQSYYNGNCGSGAMSAAGTSTYEQDFGTYSYKNTAFTCVASSSSTTNVRYKLHRFTKNSGGSKPIVGVAMAARVRLLEDIHVPVLYLMMALIVSNT